jgi:hypothetical protein
MSFPNNRKFRLLLSICLVSMLHLFMISGLGYAENVAPGSLSELYNLPADNPYINQIQLTQQVDEEIELTLADVVLDQDHLIYSLILSGDIPANSTNFYLNGEILCDGEPCSYDLGPNWIVPSEGIPPALTGVADSEIFSSEANPVGDQIQVKMTINEIEIISQVDPENQESSVRSYFIQGPWVFDFAVDGSAVAEKTVHYQLDSQFSVNGSDYEIRELVISPISQRIRLTSSGEMNFIEYITIQPDDGEEIPLSLRSTQSGYQDTVSTSMYEIAQSMDKERPLGNYFAEMDQAEKLMITPWLGDRSSYPGKTYLDTQPLREFQIEVLKKP